MQETKEGWNNIGRNVGNTHGSNPVSGSRSRRSQPLSCTGSIPHDFDDKQYNNPPITVFLVIPGEPT